jgi:hypothetical protein
VKRSAIAGALFLLVLAGGFGEARIASIALRQTQATAPAAAPTPAAVDALLAPVALYPDQLLAQMLESSKIPRRVQEFSGWLVKNSALAGTQLQDAARAAGYEPSLVLLALFPQVINYLADNIRWTTEVGQVFTTSREAVFESVQRLRAQALKAGTLKDTPQQTVQLKTTKDGKQAIVIEPANPQVVYVPTYNPQVVYTQPTTTTTTVVVKEESNNDAAVAGAVIGFTAGIAIGAAMSNNYYYGPYGWHGAPYMYNDAWDDWYDDREDAREDWYENREDAREDFYDNREDLAGQRTERASNAQTQRTERQENRQAAGTRTEAGAQRQGATEASANASTRGTRSASTEARGSSRGETRASPERSGTRSDAFSGYSSGRSERASSARGKSSRSRASGGRRGGR